MSENTNPTPVDRRNFLLTTAATGAAPESLRGKLRCASKMPMSASTSPSSVSADAARPT